jgi:penicillin amidase
MSQQNSNKQAAPSTTYRVEGLHAPATIRVDQWGVPHIDAASARDAYFVQGFNAARDRLWQIDLWRKRGLGILSESFGPGYLMQDRAARLFLYRGDMQAEWEAYGDVDAKGIAEAFAAGINAFVALTEDEPSLLPPEFATTRSKPARWRAEDVVRIRSHALGRNLPSEYARARMLAVGDAKLDLARRSIDPPHELIVPEGLDFGDFGKDVLDVYQLAVASVTFSAARLSATLADAAAWSKVDPAGEVVLNPEAEGSNNWAISPNRTVTGRPVMASDPHRAYTLPSTRYVAHLRAPGLDVIGAGEACAPGISLGHNGVASFSLTTFPLDQEDLYVYELHPEDANLYRYGESWERMTVVTEEFKVEGCPPQHLELKFTRHGPVIFEDKARRRAFAVRTVWTEPGSAPYFASLGYQDADSIDRFAAALKHWAVPTNNHVYADTKGNIAWFTAGKAPKRSNWDGLLPVPGNGTYEWEGFHSPDVLPHAVNPASGFVSSANDMNLPEGPVRELGLGFEWNEPFRGQRIREVLGEGRTESVESSLALQCDDLSIPARRLCSLLAGLNSGNPVVEQGLRLLTGWDCRLKEDSPAALLFEVWWMKHLKPALLRHLTSDQAALELLGPGDHETLLDWIEEVAPIFGADGKQQRDECLLSTLGKAMDECLSRFGDATGEWEWGKLHHGYFAHPLAGIDPMTHRDIGPLALGGSGSTVLNTNYRLRDGRANIGASFRMVLDVGAWDNSWFINAPGQSGDSRSKHYDDHADAWAKREYFPLVYSEEAIAQSTRMTFHLEPKD